MKSPVSTYFSTCFLRLLMLCIGIGCCASASAQVDWSDSLDIQIPEPRLATVNFTDIPWVPAQKDQVANAWMEFDDGVGNTFRRRVTLKLHGQYSLIYPKRNLTLKLCADEWVGDSTYQMQIGGWLKQDGFHLKAYYTDRFRGVGTVAYRLFDQVTALRGDSAFAWQRAGIDHHDKALCHPDGFPCRVLVNGKFYGLYAWQLKKDHKNMNLSKDSAQHIHLDGILCDATLFNASRIQWEQFEVRNPQKLYTMDGNRYDGDAPKELIDESSRYFNVSTDTEKVRRAKQRTAEVKHSIAALSQYHAQLTSLEEQGVDKQTIRDSIASCYDIPSLIDYVCFSYFLGNSDGFRKNWQWFTYDGHKWSVAPYDLDGILGHSGDVLLPATMASISTDYRLFGVNVGGPTYWLCRYYWDDICERYQLLRDAGVFTPDNFMTLLYDWQERIGETAYADERKAWPASPCYSEPIANPGWMTDGQWAGYSTVSDYDASRIYEAGDKCRQSERIWTATRQVSGLEPCLQSGAPDSLPRVRQWLEEHQVLYDAYLGYHGQPYTQRLVVDESGWTTLNTMLSCQIPLGMAVYQVTDASVLHTRNGQKVSDLTLQRVLCIEPYQSYLVHAQPGEYLLSGRCEPLDWKKYSNYLVTGMLTGMDEWSYVPKGKYVLQRQGSIVGFYPVNVAQKVSVEAWQAYLTAPSRVNPNYFQFSAEPCDIVPPVDVDTTWLHDLPVVELAYDSTSFNEKNFISARFTYHDADTVKTYNCRVRRRGGTSLLLDKPNFAVKFINDEGESRDVRFMDMRKDNNWILDAMASDYAKMRNRVSMDLWLDFSRPPYHQEAEPKAVNGYHGRYVEVYANGEYMGLFCLMERVDRKQLKIKKFTADETDSTQLVHRGLMYKAVSGNTVRTPFFYWQQNEPNDASRYYDGMQCEYPDVTAGEPWTWQPLRTNIYELAARTGARFRTEVPKRFDVPVFIDYVLFIDLLYANDNVGKNFYTWFYDQSSADQRLGITPWDIDASWGRNYLGGRIDATSELSNKSNFDTRMAKQWKGYADTLSIRYSELRDSLWSEQALLQRFDQYFELFARTGVWQRELDRWEHSKGKFRPLADEQEYLHQWIHDRLVYLDTIYGYEPPSAIQQISDDTDTAPAPYYDLYGRTTNRRRGLLIRNHQLILIND